MSWQQYVDTSLVGTGDVDKAAIFSKAGDSKWAASPGFDVLPQELKALVKGYDNASELQSNGLYIAKDRYVLIKADDRSIYGKKGKTGIICCKTKQAILIAHYPEHVQPGQAANTVEKLADYLISVEY